MALEEYAGDMNMCCRCSACKFIPLQQVKGFEHANVCPSISRYNFHFYAGGGRLNMGAAGLKDGFKYAPRYLDSIYNCHLCGGCDVSCKYAMDMEVLRPIQEMRIKAVEDGHAHPALDKVVARMRAAGSMVPVEGSKRGDWAAGLGTHRRHQGEGGRPLSRGLPDQLRQGHAEAGQGHRPDTSEGRRGLRHSRRRRDLLRRPGLRDGLPGGLPRAGGEEHGGHQAVRRQDPGDQLRRVLPGLQRPLRPVRSQGRPGSAAHDPADRPSHRRRQAQAGEARPTSTSPTTTPAIWAGWASRGSTGKARRSPATGSSSIRPSPTGGARTESTSLRAR